MSDSADQARTTPPELTFEEEERFWMKVRLVGRPTDCWEWIAGKEGNGYGQITIRSKAYRAHRLVLHLIGREIPAGMVVDHTCRNRACVNPDHLRVVTQHTNVHENSRARAHINSLKTHCPRGHPLSGENLMRRSCGRRRCRICYLAEQQTRRQRIAQREGVWNPGS